MTRVVRARVVPARAASSAEAVALAGRAPQSVRRVPRDEVEARARAEALVRHAEDLAQSILERAHEDAARAADAARAQAVGELIADLARARDAEHRRAEASVDALVTLATVLAERLVGEELTIRPERIEALAASALALARREGALRMAAHPADAAHLRAAFADLPQLAVAIEDDSELARGSLLVESEDGVIDARLGAQLERLAAAVRDAIARE